MLEMKMTTDLQTDLPAEIGFNFEELKTELTERLHHYNGLIVTEDTVREGKEDRAKLRKLREAIETRRKEIKKEYEKPLKAFEAQVKELVALIDAPVAAIDSQIKAFEEQERANKLAEVMAAYSEIIPDNLKEIVPFDRILDQRWLNKTTTMKNIREALEQIAKRAYVDMALMSGVDPKYMAAIRAKYIETLDITAALDYQDKLIEADERFRQQEEARAQRAAQREALASQTHQAEEKPPVAVQEPVREAQQQDLETIYLLRLEFQLSMDQANRLKKFLVDNHINYRKI